MQQMHIEIVAETPLSHRIKAALDRHPTQRNRELLILAARLENLSLGRGEWDGLAKWTLWGN